MQWVFVLRVLLHSVCFFFAVGWAFSQFDKQYIIGKSSATEDALRYKPNVLDEQTFKIKTIKNRLQ